MKTFRMKTSSVFMCSLLVFGHLYLTEATTLANRTNCGPDDAQPSTRVNTTERLAQFRDAMINGITISGQKLAAFIVLSEDAHFSEYTTDYDKRRGYISGFSGSAGTAVVTPTSAALWTDGRYFLEAEENLDCNWILMKDGLPGTPTISEWLNDEIDMFGSMVGVDKSLVSNSYFQDLRDKLQELDKRLVLREIESSQNPVDVTWTTNRPPRPTEPINPLAMDYAGKSWQDKVADLRDDMQMNSAIAFVVTSLDETAWLFNLRGTDIPYNPFFISYAIVESNRIRLYILDKDARLTSYPTDPQSDNITLAEHLQTSNTGACTGSGICVEVLDYDQLDVETALRGLTVVGNVWVAHLANYGVFSALNVNILLKNSPIALAKSMKNPIERANMQICHNRDASVLIKFLAFLEQEVQNGNEWTEITAAEELKKRRFAAENNRGLSFETISAYGSNGAIIHYRPANVTNKVISTDSLYLSDSGGQYLDGTTDVTRTLHFGEPTDYEKECYTRVLASAINLARLRWPVGLYGRQIDAIARYQLWEAGLIYRHGTGHGIGVYMSVHEGPGRISMAKKEPVNRETLYAFQFYSDEPGYYEDGKFGIRLETIVMVTPFTPKYDTAHTQFLSFTPITLVPFETNLIDTAYLTAEQIDWLNDYNALVRREILPLIASDSLATDWLNSRTEPIDRGNAGKGSLTRPSLTLIISTIALAVWKISAKNFGTSFV